MNIPDKIKIGYRDYKLEEWKQTVATANEAHGQFFSKEGIIGYTTDEKGVSHANTLLHEILHAVVYEHSLTCDGNVLSTDTNEEIVVNSITNGLMTVIKDNPWFLKFLQDNIHGRK